MKNTGLCCGKRFWASSHVFPFSSTPPGSCLFSSVALHYSESLSASLISFLSPWLAPLLSFISRWWIFCMGWSLTSYVCSLPLTSAKQSVGTASAGTTLLERGLVSSACQSPIASKPPSKIWAHDLAPRLVVPLAFLCVCRAITLSKIMLLKPQASMGYGLIIFPRIQAKKSYEFLFFKTALSGIPWWHSGLKDLVLWLLWHVLDPGPRSFQMPWHGRKKIALSFSPAF